METELKRRELILVIIFLTLLFSIICISYFSNVEIDAEIEKYVSKQALRYSSINFDCTK